jgi:MFS family permease
VPLFLRATVTRLATLTSITVPGTPRYVFGIITAQILVQIGAFAFPALLPGYIERWSISKTEAGWLVGVSFLAYIVMVPLLLALTDRVPVRRVYLFGAGLTAISHLGFALVADGFWTALILRVLAGIGWAGTFMPGLKALTEPFEGSAQSRAVSWHAAAIGVSGAASFGIAGFVGNSFGVSAAFLMGASTALAAFLLAGTVMHPIMAQIPETLPQRRLLDFRPILRNRAVMGWIIAYTAHTWELAALRAWGVTFLVTTVAHYGAPTWLPDPTVLFTVAVLVGIAVSITGNEVAQRLGRVRVVTAAMSTAAALSLVAGWSAGASAPLAAILIVLWNAAIYFDSSALTAGTLQAAHKELRGMTMGLHSMCGEAGGFFGAVGVGLVLDGVSGVSGWGFAFGHIALVTLIGLLILRRLSTHVPAPAQA